jgi:hypothetical protein
MQFFMGAWYANRQTIHGYVDRLPAMNQYKSRCRMCFRLMVGLLMVVCVASCGSSASDTSTATQTSKAIAVAMVNSAPIASCPNGGMTVQSDVDANANQILELSEATNAQYICNGANGTDGVNGADGALGASGFNAQMVVTNEPIGSNCSDGGSVVRVGWDVNGNAILDASEITSLSYICQGVGGANGLNGSNGFSTLSHVTVESASANCINGGQKTTMGVDGNFNSVLDLSEITSTTYVCNGSNGSSGAVGLNSLIAVTPVPANENCFYGGSVLTSGLDRNVNRVLDEEEVTARTYICNASAITKPAYAYIYNVSDQVVAVGAPVLFDRNGLLSEFEHTEGASEIRVLSAGIYTVEFSISGTEPNQFAIFVNRNLVPGSIYGSGAGTQQNNGQITLELALEDVLTLVNYSSAAAVGLASKIGGTQANVNALVRIQKID